MIGLTCLLAHTGSFVPAGEMKLPLLDRIFTRVGAGDDITQGHSTFMVEMAETAKILNYATTDSLILLDEIGRGTSTYDGLSLAWSIVEYIHDRISARTVFATHYHELVQVVTDLAHGQNISVQVQKHKDSVVFLYEVARVAASESFGIEVAKMAGIPHAITKRAKHLLKVLESQHQSSEQLDIFAAAVEEEEVEVSHPVLDALAGIDPNSLSPMEALELVFALKKEV
jgi:DNA mismatch repair protein MutS